MTRRRSFAANVAVYTGVGALVALMSLANVIVTSRSLGPPGRGAVAFLTTVAMLGSQLSSLGVEEATANVAAQEPERRPSLATNALIFAVALGALAAVAIVALTRAVPAAAVDSPPVLLAAAVLAIPLLVFQFYLVFLIRADYGFAVTNLVAVVGPAVNLVANGVLATTGRLTVTATVTAWIGGQALATAILVRYVSRRLAGFGRPDRKLARRMLRFGVQAHAGRMMKAGNYRLDQWLLGAIAGQRELGLYSVAVAWSEGMFFLPEALAAVLRPDVARAGREDAGHRTAAAFRAGLVLMVPTMLVFLLAAPVLCTTVFGDAFAGSVVELRVLALGALGIVAMKVLANSLTAQGRPMLGNAAIGIAFLTTVALDLLLIPTHGGLGAAIASSIAYSVGGAAVAVIFARSVGLRLRVLAPGVHDVRALAAVHR